MGLNYYHSNQWVYPDTRIRWEDVPRDPRWVPFHRLVAEIFDRYRHPIFIGETSHFGDGRAAWIAEMAREVHLAREAGVPIQGLCLFPIIDRMDWNDPHHWHNSGLWDLVRDPDGRLVRVLNVEYDRAVQRARLAMTTGEWESVPK